VIRILKKIFFRYLICIVFIISFKVSAATYYVSNSGNDNSNGLTRNTPWSTIKKVNNIRLFPGDSVLFKCGDIWREGEALYIQFSGSVSEPIVYGSYSKGMKPLITAGKDISGAHNWVRYSGCIWRTKQKINITTVDKPWQISRNTDISNLLFNNEKSVGNKKRFLNDLIKQGDFCLNSQDTLLYIYSLKNPAEFYTHIEAAGVRNCEDNIVVQNKECIRFSNLDIRYSKNNGIFISSSNHIVIENCNFSWIGGCYYQTASNLEYSVRRPVRMGNGVQIWLANSNITVNNCTFNQIYDAAISPQGAGSVYAIRNLKFHHNLIRNCYYSFEFWGHEKGSVCDSLFFENNTCIDAGKGWSTAQRPDTGRSAHLQFSKNKMTFTNVYIRNNIFFNAQDYCLYSLYDSNDSRGLNSPGIIIDYNCYHMQGKNKKTIMWRGGNTEKTVFYSNNFLDYQTQSIKDLHSLYSNPRLNAAHRLKAVSPVIDKGINISFDYLGLAPDLGAFERR